MAEIISVTARQIGTGLPLPTPTVTGVAVDKIIGIYPTQNQAGGGQPYDKMVFDPKTAAAVYSRITVSNGAGISPTFIFCSDKVADLITAANA